MKTTLCLTSFFLLVCAPVQAQDKHGMGGGSVEFGDVVVCDTQEQAERYVALYHGDTDAAVRAVNRQENDPRVEIVRILVFGIDSQGAIRPVRPAPYFTAFGVTEYDV